MYPPSPPFSGASPCQSGAVGGSDSTATVSADDHVSSDSSAAGPASSHHSSPTPSAPYAGNDSGQAVPAASPSTALQHQEDGRCASESSALDSQAPGGPASRPATSYIMTGPLPGLPRPRTETVLLDPASAASPLTLESAAAGSALSGSSLGSSGTRAPPGSGSGRGAGAWPPGGAPQGRTLVTVPSVCGSRRRYMHALLQRSAAWMMFSKGVQSVEPQCLEYVSSWLAFRIGAIGRQAKIYANIRGTSVANYFDVKQALFDVCPASYAALFRTTGVEPVAGTQPKEVLLGADGRGRRARQAALARGAEADTNPPLEGTEAELVVTTEDSWVYRRLVGEPADPLGAEESNAVSGVSAPLAAGPATLDTPHDAPVGREDAQRSGPLGPGTGPQFPGAAASPPDASPSAAGPGGAPGGTPRVDLSGGASPAVGPAAGGAGALPGAPGYADVAPTRGDLGPVKPGSTRSAEPPLHIPPWLPQFPPAHLWACTPTPSAPACDGVSLDFKRQCAKMELQLHLPQLQLPQLPPPSARWGEGGARRDPEGDDSGGTRRWRGGDSRMGMKRGRNAVEGDTANHSLWGLPRDEGGTACLSEDDEVEKEAADADVAGEDRCGGKRRGSGKEENGGKGKKRRTKQEDEVIEREVVAGSAQFGKQGNLLLSW
ncbi:transcription initiation factor TFIID complex subunit TAF8 [Toxoplasma gondii TgCatPRC2]|uniref:Transcription initiation factor TFIID complex subunit TAF8 n=1 Tax=Toxoplasma gondii TgCatPRC2 TaxID=1130821 RepID=A0A151H7V9_TOXGO|nr:transcription initiation factor TFIID complex subunit TAF8 [Toxoplasma gondii TgCatPRC2]